VKAVLVVVELPKAGVCISNKDRPDANVLTCLKTTHLMSSLAK
jgi:hypothetical protein